MHCSLWKCFCCFLLLTYNISVSWTPFVTISFLPGSSKLNSCEASCVKEIVLLN
jgi:hypothetical protein